MSELFYIKHLSGGRYLQPHSGWKNPVDYTFLIFRKDVQPNMEWRFMQVEGQWGYIEHKSSGKILHISGNSPLLFRARHNGALFAFDQVNNHIIHKSGKFVHPWLGRFEAGTNSEISLESDVNKEMEFGCVSVANPSKKFLVYGVPNVRGNWKMIDKSTSLRFDCKSQLLVKVGYLNTESYTSGVKYKWQGSSTADNLEIFMQAAAPQLKNFVRKASSETWENETIRTREINVKKGTTMVTWQFVFTVQQNASKSVFQSNLLANTESEAIEPSSWQYSV